MVFERSIAGLAILAVSGSSLAAADEPASQSWLLRASAIVAAGSAATSPSFEATASAGQAAPVGASSSPTFLLQSGLWGFAGVGSIPIVLAVARNESNAEHCDLRWSGNAPPYVVFATENCANVLASPHDTTSGNSLLDLSPPDAPLTCLAVLELSDLPLAVPRPAPAGASR